MTDHLYRDVSLSHTVQLPVLGVTIAFATNSRDLFEAVQDAFGSWGAIVPQPNVVSPSQAIVKLICHDGAGIPSEPMVFRYRVPDKSRMLITAPGSFGIADTLRLESIAYLTESVVAQRPELIEGLLEPLVLFLLGALDRQPLHAAAVMRGPFAIILAGPSGAGKSTVTYAAQRKGYDVLGDEPLYIQLWPRLRIWGRKLRIHVPVEARVHFAELLNAPVTRLLSGKTKIVIQPVDAQRRWYADHAGVCVLGRAAGPRPTLQRLSSDQVVTELTGRVEPGFDLYSETLGACAARLAERGGWRLNLTGSPEDALPLLDEVAAQLEKEG